MSVELYPNVQDLDEKLSALEDPQLAERVVSAHPELFPSAAAREEISVFAAAWKRFGSLALAAAAVASLVAGYVVTPMLNRHPAAVAPPAAVVRKAPAHVLAPSHHAIPALVRRAVSHPAAVVVPAAVVAPRPLVAHHVAAAAAPVTHARPTTAVSTAAAPPAELPLGHDPNAIIVSGNVPVQDVPVQTAAKGLPPGASPHVQWGEPGSVVDSCTPQGGRIGAIIQAVGGGRF